MTKVVTVEEHGRRASQRNSDVAKTVATMMGEYATLFGGQVVDVVRNHEAIDFDSVTGIKIETLFGLAPGEAKGASQFVYFSPKMGTVSTLLLLFGRGNRPTYSFNEKVGGRHTTIKVYCDPKPFKET